MRVLVVAPTPFFSDRGTHIRILEESLALEKLGHKITIATYHIGKEINREIDTQIDVRRIRSLLFWYKKLEAGPDWQKIILDIMLIRKTFYLARTEKPDIIHGHLHEGVLIGWIVQKILFWRHMKLVADFHGSLTREMLSHGYLKRGLRFIFSCLERFINSLGDFTITSSWEETADVKRTRKDGKVETVLDGANVDGSKVNKSKEEIKKEWEIPKEKFVVGYTGGLVPNKGIDFLLEAIPVILKERKNIFFLIGGFPTEGVERFIRKNSLKSDEVRLVSPLDYFKLFEFLNICDVAIDPKGSDTGQASGKMLNYMGAGLPVICFDKVNNRNYLGEGGYFCGDMSGESISKGIIYFMDNPDDIIRKGKLNQERAYKYGWNKTAQKINDIYDKIQPTATKSP